MVDHNQPLLQPGAFDLMIKALTHSSYANEKQIESNERLELLGDAVISLACLDYLYKKYPDYDEGILTQMKSTLVNGKQLAEIGEFYRVDKYIRIGSGESLSKKTIGRVVEAVIGAFFLEEGYNDTQERLNTIFQKIEAGEITQVAHNYKGDLQRFSQAVYRSDPVYRVCATSGEDHNKEFTVSVTLNKIPYANGIGTSIKDAEQQAAKIALSVLNTDKFFGEPANVGEKSSKFLAQ